MHVRKDFVKEYFKSLHSMWFYQQIHVKFISSYQTVTNTTCISSLYIYIYIYIYIQHELFKVNSFDFEVSDYIEN